jgi:hypothetical protein
MSLMSVGTSDAATLADEIAEALRAAQLRGWLPCLTGFDGLETDASAKLARLRRVVRDHPGPVVLRCGPETRPPIDPAFIVLDLPALAEGDRARFWRACLVRHGLSGDAAPALAARHAVTPGTIEQVIRRAAFDPPGDGAVAALDGLVRQHRQHRLADVATRVLRLGAWPDLVLPPEILDSLREFVGRIRHRRRVLEEWGFDRVTASARGLTALLEGAPGTGKTLIAGVLARELGGDLYRIDLGRVLSKWIGETERNLGAAFDAAEDGQTILLFDEADSLFARRTEVRSANDRHANAEINYLLQRLDSFEGIAILTTNHGAAIDPAFKRRLSMRIAIPVPDASAREELWRVHLPTRLPRAGSLDLAKLARRFSLSGGHIRNAALRAAYLSAEEGTPLTQDLLERAVRLEYQDAGRIADTGSLA